MATPVSIMTPNAALGTIGQPTETVAGTQTNPIITAPATATGTSSASKLEDVPAADGDRGDAILLVRHDTLAAQTNTDGDYTFSSADKYGDSLIKSYEKHARTYSAAMNVVAAAAATDIAVIGGSASTTVFVTRVIISGIQTSAGLNDILLIKRSAADTGGTFVAATAIPHDSADVPNTNTVGAYTANPGALGSAVGTIRRAYQPIGGATSVVNPVVVYDFGERGKPIVLNGVAQQLCVNLNGATLTGGTFDIDFEWFEI